MSININFSKLIKLIFSIILYCIIIYFIIKIIKKLFCKKEYITLPTEMLLASNTNDMAYYTITSSSLF